MAGDWVRLHRKALGSRVFSDPWLWRLWCWCLLKACWKEGWKDGRQLLPGQFATGRNDAAEQLNVSPSKWYRGMRILAEWGQVSLSVNSRFTVVTVCNWRTYQYDHHDDRTTDEQQMNSGRTADGQPSLREEGEEGKEGHNGCAVRAPPSRAFRKPALEEVAAYCRERNNRVDPAAWLAHYESNGWRVGRNPMKDWRAAVRTWEHNGAAFRPAGKNDPPPPPREPSADNAARIAREREESLNGTDPDAMREGIARLRGKGNHP